MKKETVVRQNRCDQEMNFLLFACFFFFVATQLLIGKTGQEQLVNKVNMLLYAVFVPGFIFRIGYQYGRMRRQNSAQHRRRWLLRTAGRYLFYFFLLTFALEIKRQIIGAAVAQKKYAVIQVLADVISLLRIPAVSAVFFAMALTLLAVWFADDKLTELVKHKKKMAVLGGVLLLCAAFRVETDAYVVVASLIGSAVQPGVPAVPYFVFFLFGIWIEEKKPAFDWHLALVCAGFTAVSLLLYGTFARDVCRVAMSFLPVYLVYVFAEGLAELTLRFKGIRFACEKIEAVFGIYFILMFVISAAGLFAGADIWKVLLVAALVMGLIAAGFAGFWLLTWCCKAVSVYVEQKVRHKTAAYFVLFTAGFAFVLFLAFFDFVLRGKTLIYTGDGISQYFPKVVYFSQYMRDLVAGVFSGHFELPMYDFASGLGGEITYSLEPLYFLYVLFGEEHLEFAYSLVTLLRFYLSGVTFSILCLYFKKNYFATFLGSVVYVVCGFALNGGAMHPMFMVPMIMLPLLILSIEEILRHKRWYLCTVFVAVSLFSNYYYLYMNTIAMGVYFLVRFFCQKDRTKKTFQNFMGRGLVISGSYLLGVAMSCIVLATTFGRYLGSGRGDAAYIKTASLIFYRAEWLVSCFLTFLTTANSPGEWLRLGHLPIAMLAIAFLFFRKGRKELKAFSVIALVFAAFPVFGFIFSGFSAVINRWSYMITLVAAFTVTECYPDMLELKKSEKRVLAGLMAVYGFLAFFGKYKSTLYVQAAFVLLVVTFLVLLFNQEENRRVSKAAKQCLMLCLTAGIVLYQGFSLYEMDGVIHDFTAPGEAVMEEMNTPLRAVSEVGDESFYRSAMPKLAYYTSNMPSVLGYNSNTTVSSTYNGRIKDYLRQMGCTSYSMTQLKGMNNRTFLDALAAVKYYAYFDEPGLPLPYGYKDVLSTKIDGKQTTVCENQYALPIGYTYDMAITEEELEAYPVLERQEVMLQQAVLSEELALAKADSGYGQTPVITGRTVEILDITEEGAVLEEHALVAGTGEPLEKEINGTEKNTYKITLEFQSLPDAETYLVLHDARLKGDQSETPIRLTFRAAGSRFSYTFEAEDYRYGTGQEDYVFNLGYHEEPVTSCEITMDRSGKIDFEDLTVYSQPMENMGLYTEKLTEHVLEDVTIGTNEVSGEISLDREKLLVLSIPYQKGWKAYVDGEEVEIHCANYTYMALRLAPGKHSVKLTFEIPAVKYALVIMPGAVVLFIILLAAGWLIKRRKISRSCG